MQSKVARDKKPLIVHMAEWITQRESVWPQEVILRTEHALADTLACIVAGASDPVACKARAASQLWGEGNATVIGGGVQLSAPGAALVNGTAAHVLEIDDNYYPALTHASAVIVPALLALADELNSKGCELIDAYIVGLEIHALLGRGVNRSHYFAGWHPTATIGCIGTAAACARLLRLNLEQTIAAVSIATSMACGNKAQFGTEVKSLQCGIGASNAVKAARLAQAGIQGNPDVLEDPQGFLSLYGGPNPRGWAEPLLKLDNPLAMQEYGLAPKRHACCGSAHNTLDSILALVEEHKFTADDVLSVEVLIGSSNRKNLRYDNPVDEFQARFSMNYNVALILLQGKVTLDDFTAQAVQRPEVRDLFSVTTTNARSFEEEPLDPDDRPPHLVKITLKDGRILERSRIFAKGLIQDPFTDSERRLKLVSCCEPVLGTAKTTELEAVLMNISTVCVRDLTNLLK
ncbi:MmgE/PrpD family protein [Pseudomonas putida]|uniref:MmgE/PrpD family protein n=1 Tax=Pseudomonas putida TaxID=303 RepID=UPI0018A9D5D6|nr:MmgE/PrpD family protein [Pseudomonas putida]MBF8668284.1 MmgE/PrpD family protein [Pseudomonas putida]MBF8711784.1 MmgE/PrpD family protein [Pseudomonas putida]